MNVRNLNLALVSSLCFHPESPAILVRSGLTKELALIFALVSTLCLRPNANALIFAIASAGCCQPLAFLSSHILRNFLKVDAECFQPALKTAASFILYAGFKSLM